MKSRCLLGIAMAVSLLCGAQAQDADKAQELRDLFREDAQCRAYVVRPLLEQLRCNLQTACTPEEEVVTLTLLCYYGTFFGLDEYVNLIPFPYDDVPVWEGTRETLRYGQRHLDMLCEPANIPIILPDNVEVTSIPGKPIGGYSVSLRQDYLETLPENIAVFVDHSFFKYGRFSQWFHVEKYDGFVYAYGELRRRSF